MTLRLTPDRLYGELFEQVQIQRVLGDSKSLLRHAHCKR